MVSANSLHLDIVETICAHLQQQDLVSVALVSRAFYSGVIPRLYRSLVVRPSHGARLTPASSPFRVILAHPELAVHVHAVDIRSVPMYKARIDAAFMRDCTSAIRLCSNLSSFTCTSSELPAFLMSLQNPDRLSDVRIRAFLRRDMASDLLRMSALLNLVLDGPSAAVLNIMPAWAGAIARTLTALTIDTAKELNEDVLESTLKQLPGLTGLHIVNCSQVDHVAVCRLTQHTPLLESLSCTTFENPRSLSILPLPPHLPHLTHLALDTRCSIAHNSAQTCWTEMFATLATADVTLRSLALRMSTPLDISEQFMQALAHAHGSRLRSLRFLNCGVNNNGLRILGSRCGRLEVIAMRVPSSKDMDLFIQALSTLRTVHTLVDLDDGQHMHSSGPARSLSRATVQDIMRKSSVRKIVAQSRQWIGEEIHEGLKVSLARQKLFTSTTHWFMPQ